MPGKVEGAGATWSRIKSTHYVEFINKSQIAHKETWRLWQKSHSPNRPAAARAAAPEEAAGEAGHREDTDGQHRLHCLLGALWLRQGRDWRGRREHRLSHGRPGLELQQRERLGRAGKHAKPGQWWGLLQLQRQENKAPGQSQDDVSWSLGEHGRFGCRPDGPPCRLQFR